MENLYNELRRNLSEHSELENRLKKSLSQTLDGNLTVKHINGGSRFYVQYERNRLASQYLGKDKISTVTALAQKGYDAKILKEVEKRRKAVEKCLKTLDSADAMQELSKVLDRIPKEARPFIKTIDSLDEEYVKEWSSLKYRKKPVSNESPFYTKKNEHVRSKSEVIIADRLFYEGIPYHYEVPISLNQMDVLHPDFFVLNKRTRKAYFWEHLGMMDSPSYCIDNVRKLQDYANAGYLQGKNFIVTFETSKTPLETKYIDALIKEYLK